VVDISCRNPSYACKDLDAHIVSEVMELAHDQAAFLRIVNTEKPQTIPEGKKTTLLRRIDELDAQMRRVMDLYQLGNISILDIKERLAALEKERDALNAQLKEEAAEHSTLLHPSVAQSLLSDFVHVSDSGDTTAIRNILRELIQRVIVLPEKGKLQIIWNF
jgi:site-specific DNA recombinase